MTATRDYECPTCGREYTDVDALSPFEYMQATQTGYCCEMCEEDNSPEQEIAG